MIAVTWLDSILARGFDEGTREMLVNEAQRTRFPGHLPPGFECLQGTFLDLGFENLGLSAEALALVRLAFVGVGVAVPGTPYRLRHARPFFSYVEPADGSEGATLPAHWREAVIVADS